MSGTFGQLRNGLSRWARRGAKHIPPAAEPWTYRGHRCGGGAVRAGCL